MPASILIEHLKGDAPGAATPVSFCRFRADDNDERNQLAAVTAPQNVHTTSSQKILGSTSEQAVDVVSSAFFTPGDFAIVEPGKPNQEVVVLTAFTDAGVASGIFRKNHPFGCEIRKVSAAYSKVFQVRMAVAPDAGGSVANLRMKRVGDMPPGTYDQFRIVDTYAQAADMPWASDATHKYNLIPSEPVQVALGPWVTPVVMVMVEIQWLFTAQTGIFPEVRFEFVWDEA